MNKPYTGRTAGITSQDSFAKKHIWPKVRLGAKWLAISTIIATQYAGIARVNGDDYFSRISRGIVNAELNIADTILPPYNSHKHDDASQMAAPEGGLEAAMVKNYIIPADEKSEGVLMRIMGLETAPIISEEITDEQYEMQLKNIVGATINGVAYDVMCNSRSYSDQTLMGRLTRENAYEAFQTASDERNDPNGFARGYFFDENGSMLTTPPSLDDFRAYHNIRPNSKEDEILERRYETLTRVIDGLLTGKIENPFNINVVGYKNLNTEAFPDVPQDIRWELYDGNIATVVDSDVRMDQTYPIDLNHVYWNTTNPIDNSTVCPSQAE